MQLYLTSPKGLTNTPRKFRCFVKFIALRLYLAFPKSLANAPKKLPAWRSLSPYDCVCHSHRAWQMHRENFPLSEVCRLTTALGISEGLCKYIKETEIASELSGLFCVCRLCLRSDIPGRPSKAVEKAEKLRFREALPDERTSVLCIIVGLFAMGSAVFGVLSQIIAVFHCFPVVAAIGTLRGLPSWKVLASCAGFNSLSARKCARRRQPQSALPFPAGAVRLHP